MPCLYLQYVSLPHFVIITGLTAIMYGYTLFLRLTYIYSISCLFVCIRFLDWLVISLFRGGSGFMCGE
jgi:hypothetical protein